MLRDKVARALKDGLPDVDVEVTAKGRVLTIVVLGSADTTRVLHERVGLVLMDTGLLDDAPVVQLASYPSRVEWIRQQAQDLLIAAVGGGRLYVDVRTRYSDGFLGVEIICENGYENREVQDQVNGVLPEIGRLVGPNRFRIHYSDGMPHYSVGLPAIDDDFDGEPENPNWPSKTGNPSGKGRGNNPPKSGR